MEGTEEIKEEIQKEEVSGFVCRFLLKQTKHAGASLQGDHEHLLKEAGAS